MTLRTTKLTIDPEAVPAVRAFLIHQEALDAFRKKHAAMLDQLTQLADQYNTTLEMADKELRTMCTEQSAGISCGPFIFQHYTTKYDPDALLHELGNDDTEFQKMAGIVQTVRVNKIDTSLMESLIERGAVHPDLQSRFVTRTPNYKKPKKLVVP